MPRIRKAFTGATGASPRAAGARFRVDTEVSPIGRGIADVGRGVAQLGEGIRVAGERAEANRQQTAARREANATMMAKREDDRAKVNSTIITTQIDDTYKRARFEADNAGSAEEAAAILKKADEDVATAMGAIDNQLVADKVNSWYTLNQGNIALENEKTAHSVQEKEIAAGRSQSVIKTNESVLSLKDYNEGLGKLSALKTTVAGTAAQQAEWETEEQTKLSKSMLNNNVSRIAVEYGRGGVTEATKQVNVVRQLVAAGLPGITEEEGNEILAQMDNIEKTYEKATKEEQAEFTKQKVNQNVRSVEAKYSTATGDLDTTTEKDAISYIRSAYKEDPELNEIIKGTKEMYAAQRRQDDDLVAQAKNESLTQLYEIENHNARLEYINSLPLTIQPAVRSAYSAMRRDEAQAEKALRVTTNPIITASIINLSADGDRTDAINTLVDGVDGGEIASKDVPAILKSINTGVIAENKEYANLVVKQLKEIPSSTLEIDITSDIWPDYDLDKGEVAELGILLTQMAGSKDFTKKDLDEVKDAFLNKTELFNRKLASHTFEARFGRTREIVEQERTERAKAEAQRIKKLDKTKEQ